MIDLTIEDAAGAELARIEVEQVPRVGEHINTLTGVYYVQAVIWELTDAPLTAARLIVEDRA